MGDKGFGTAVGWIFEWIGRWTDPKQRSDRKIQKVEKEIDALRKGTVTQKQIARLDFLLAELSRMRAERSRLKD